MYKTLPVVKDAEARAADAAYADRIRFQPFLVAIEKYAAAHRLILYGHAADRLLSGQSEIDFDTMALSFYCTDAAAAHARALADLLWAAAPDGLGHYTTMLTKIPGLVFAIAVDGRDICTLTAISAGAADRLRVARPKSVQAMLAPTRLLCMDAAAQLMDTYAALCNPARAGEWAALLKIEPAMRGRMGPEAAPAALAPIPAALLAFAAGPGRVLLGPAALQPAGQRLTSPGGVLQLVSTEPLESEALAIMALTAAVAAPGARWAIHRADVPSAPRLRRLSVHVGGRAIAEVYNAGGHELVPFARRAALRAGTPYAVARFSLVDGWMSGASRGRRPTCVAAAAACAAALPPAELLPITEYAGRSGDFVLEQRRAVQAAADAGQRVRFYGPYMPAARRPGAAEP